MVSMLLYGFFFFSSRRRHTRLTCDWSSDVCSSDLVRARSTVTRVLTNREGTRVSGLEYYDAKKERQVQEASVVVLAAWSAQNPRLLLNSATDRHPRGLA